MKKRAFDKRGAAQYIYKPDDIKKDEGDESSKNSSLMPKSRITSRKAYSFDFNRSKKQTYLALGKNIPFFKKALKSAFESQGANSIDSDYAKYKHLFRTHKEICKLPLICFEDFLQIEK
jgi:hypothetical protein